ncbi:MAG TPA: transporter substrate-binding domain-containing protein [Azospirillaceae bacterium]|nr:transporter substrate-binding domain-containing protein [Azospirillaceae bacterium]
MRDAIRLVLLCGLAALAAAGARAEAGQAGPPAGAHTIILAADPWCPYNCDPKADGQEGYMIDIARAVFEPLGYRIDYRLEPWSAALRLAADGKVQGLVGAAETDFAELVFPERSLGKSANALAARRGYDFTFHDVHSLEAHRVAVIRDYSYGDLFDGYIEENGGDPARIQVFSGFGYALLNQSLRALVEMRVDLVLEDANVLAWGVRRLNLADRVTLHPVDDADDVFIGFAPGQPHAKEYARLLSEGIDRLRRDGTLARILAAYGLKDWAPARR